MYSVGGSQTISRHDLFSTNFNRSDGEFVNSDLYQNQQNQQSSGLMRYRSAPSSFFQNLLVDGGGDFSSHESESIFGRLMASNNGSGESEPHDLQFPTGVVKNETVEQNQYSTSTTSTPVIYQQLEKHNSDGVSTQTNLIRQSSSPAELFSSLTVENGFAVMRDVGNFEVGNRTSEKASPTKRLNYNINFSSGPSSRSRFMPQIAENGNESGSPENEQLGNGLSSNGYYVPRFQNESWNDSGFTGLKRSRDGEENFSGFNGLESQNGDSRNYSTGLTHQLSLPKTSAEMAAKQKYLQFQQDSVPCKIRAKRGCATHPRSIAERIRRTRISERMRKLQELFPNMDKQTNTADMLDLAVEYIKDLQKQVKTLADTRARCTCSSKQKQLSNSIV